ncbi:MAG: endolytic transglycosylase MltG, partial [Clostridiaceae bacterium]|nr:endolytic transglycosylase MltG [Clostridiaceae bacterium]
MKKQKNKKRKNRLLSFFLYMLFFLVIFVICGFASYKYVSNQDNTDSLEVLKSIDPENSVEVVIPFGSNTNKILEILMEKKLVKNPLLFKLISKINGYEYLYKSGKHILSTELSYEEIMKVLCSAPVTVTVTIPEGKNFDEIVKILEDKKLIIRDDFINIAEKESFGYKFLENIPERKNRLEGYLFPDTYFFDPASNPKDMIAKFLNNFDNKFKVEFYKRAEDLGMTVDDVIILASIIEKEAALAEEMPIVSSVF